MGANWKVDKSNLIVEKCMEAGIAPYGNAKARAKVWQWADPIPKHREPLHTPRTDLIKDYPSFADKKITGELILDILVNRQNKIGQKISQQTL